MSKIDLVQPRHTGATDDGVGHIYLPSSLTTVGARILAAGGEISFQDANVRPVEYSSHIVGVNVVGAPYIPVVITLRQELSRVLGDEALLVLGGQVLSGLTPAQCKRLFPDETTRIGNDDAELAKILGLDVRDFPAHEKVDSRPVYEQLSDEDFKLYMQHEFCLYLSQGCKYACDFCAAVRTSRDPVTGALSSVRERYRDLSVVESELDYLITRAEKLGIHSFEIYLSNLDTFQTPQKLKEFAQRVIHVKKRHPGFLIRLRGLATAAEFMNTYASDTETISLMVEAGLWSIGFGVDGTSKEVWRSLKKSQINLPTCIEAIRVTRKEFGITPEVFMVVGHAHDTEQTLLDDVEFVLDMSEQFGAAPRPYIAKSAVPGNSGWSDPAYADLVESCLQNPQLFQCLDYAALPTELTHPNIAMHENIKDAFMMLLQVPGNTTQCVYPESVQYSAQKQAVFRRLNRGKFDR